MDKKWKHIEHLIGRILVFGMAAVAFILFGFPTIILLMFGGGGSAEHFYKTETVNALWKLSALLLLLPIIGFKFFINYQKGQSSKAWNYAWAGLVVVTITLLFAADYDF